MRSFYHAPQGFFPLLSPQRKRGYTSSSNTQRRAPGTLRRPTKFARNCSRKHTRALSRRTQSRRFLQQMRAPPGVRLRALSQTAGQLLLYRVGSHCRTQTRRLRIDAPGLRECLPSGWTASEFGCHRIVKGEGSGWRRPSRLVNKASRLRS